MATELEGDGVAGVAEHQSSTQQFVGEGAEHPRKEHFGEAVANLGLIGAPILQHSADQSSQSHARRKEEQSAPSSSRKRRDPLRNPADRRVEPVPSDTQESLKYQNPGGPVRHRRVRAGELGNRSTEAGHSQPRSIAVQRVTIAMSGTTSKSSGSKLPLSSLPVPLLPSIQHNGDSASLPSHFVPSDRSPFVSSMQMPGALEYQSTITNVSTVAPFQEITAGDEASLFEPDIFPDDVEVLTMLDPDPLSMQTPGADHVAGARKVSLVRKRSIHDDGSDLHGSESHLPSQSGSMFILGNTGLHSSNENNESINMRNEATDNPVPPSTPDALSSPPPLFLSDDDPLVEEDMVVDDEESVPRTHQEQVPSLSGSSVNPSSSDESMNIASDAHSSAQPSPADPSPSQVTSSTQEDFSNIPKVLSVDGREMVDVATFNRTIQYFGKRAFLDGYEEARATLRVTPPSHGSGVSRGSLGNHSTPTKGGATPSSGQSGGDGDDEGSDGEHVACLKGRKARKSTGKRAAQEVLLMDGIRNFMTTQGLSHKKGGSFPLDVSNQDIEKFASEGNSAGPKLASNGTFMRLEWKKSTKKSNWNARAVVVLSTELHRHIKDGEVKDVKYDPKSMTLKFCTKQVIQRLDRVRRDRLAHDENRLNIEKARTDQTERRRGRRKNRMGNRIKIAKRKARGGANEIWKDAQEVIETLNIDGQSNDETEEEDVFGHRVVRRLRRPWINKDVSSLMVAIDSYSMEAKDQAGIRKQGNVGLTRNINPKTDDERPYMINLPINFYDTDWYRKLDEYDKAGLNVRPAMNIPDIVHYVRPHQAGGYN